MKHHALIATAAAVLLFGCGNDRGSTGSSSASPASGDSLPQGTEPVRLDPSNFVATIDNPYSPMKPGAQWTYHETSAQSSSREVVVTATSQKQDILGIQATVVHDVVTEGGQVTEDTWDWYAQDRAGNVWYLGEDTTKTESGKTSKEGSWQAGVDGAQAGIVMPRSPRTGMKFRQEYYKGHAEDRVMILATDARTTVPFKSFENVVKTKDVTPLKPSLIEHKYFARGVGLVETIDVAGGSDHEVLVMFTPGR